MEKNNDHSYSNGLPPEFKRSITDSFDRRYVATLLSSIAIHCIFVVYFLFNPLTQDESYLRISEIQERLARVIKAREVKLELVDNKIEQLIKDGQLKKAERQAITMLRNLK